jgi:hypothetical protein
VFEVMVARHAWVEVRPGRQGDERADRYNGWVGSLDPVTDSVSPSPAWHLDLLLRARPGGADLPDLRKPRQARALPILTRR